MAPTREMDFHGVRQTTTCPTSPVPLGVLRQPCCHSLVARCPQPGQNVDLQVGRTIFLRWRRCRLRLLERASGNRGSGFCSGRRAIGCPPGVPTYAIEFAEQDDRVKTFWGITFPSVESRGPTAQAAEQSGIVRRRRGIVSRQD